MLTFFTSIWGWITNPKNRTVLKLIGVAILIAIILMQFGQNRGLKSDIENQKSEAQRAQNNLDALHDTIRQGKINDTTLLAERRAIKITLKELKTNYSDLMVGFEQFKKQNPKVIERITFNNTETIREVLVSGKIDANGNGMFSFNDSAKFADGNYRKLSGNIGFESKFYKKSDSTLVAFKDLGLNEKIFQGTGNFKLEQGIKLKVGLFEDQKTKKVSIGVTTSYPNITFTKLEGADIMSDEISKKAARQLRKTWGLGISAGYGFGVDLSTSRVFLCPQVGISLHYSPKILQWGK